MSCSIAHCLLALDALSLSLPFSSESAHQFVTSWQWNDVRYPRRSPLRILAEQLMKDSSKSDEALKKQVAEYNEVRTAFTAIERRDQGTLLVRPMGPYVKKQPIETAHLTTLLLVVPRARKEEFESTYETLESAAAIKEQEEAKKKAAENAERARKDAERKAAADEAAGSVAGAAKTEAQQAAEKEKAAAKAAEAEKEAEAKKLEAEMVDPVVKAQKEAAARLAEEEEKRKNKKLPVGLNAIVPRSAVSVAHKTPQCDESSCK